MKKSRLYSLVLAAILLFGFAGTAGAAAEIPPAPDEYYYDEMGVLSQETKKLLRDTNKELEQKTGSQVIVATVKDLDGYPVFDYSVEMFNDWKIGDAVKENGVLILLAGDSAGEDTYIEIRTGYGVEGVLNDGKVGRIIDTFMMDHFTRGDLDTGLREGFKAVVAEVAKEYGVEMTGDFDEYSETLEESQGPSLLTVLIVLVILYYVTRNMRGGGGGGGYRRRPRTTVFFPMGGGGRSSGGFGGGGFRGGGGSTGGGGAGRSF